MLFEVVWRASITCGYSYYGLSDYSSNIVWVYDNYDKHTLVYRICSG